MCLNRFPKRKDETNFLPNEGFLKLTKKVIPNDWCLFVF